jgi:hypothetical protein
MLHYEIRGAFQERRRALSTSTCPSKYALALMVWEKVNNITSKG